MAGYFVRRAFMASKGLELSRRSTPIFLAPLIVLRVGVMLLGMWYLMLREWRSALVEELKGRIQLRVLDTSFGQSMVDVN